MTRLGRPPKPDPKWQDQLTLRQALRYIRGHGGRMGYAKLHRAIALGQLLAVEDQLRLDRYRKPLLCVTKADLDAWLNGGLRPVTALMPLSA